MVCKIIDMPNSRDEIKIGEDIRVTYHCIIKLA